VPSHQLGPAGSFRPEAVNFALPFDGIQALVCNRLMRESLVAPRARGPKLQVVTRGLGGSLVRVSCACQRPAQGGPRIPWPPTRRGQQRPSRPSCLGQEHTKGRMTLQGEPRWPRARCPESISAWRACSPRRGRTSRSTASAMLRRLGACAWRPRAAAAARERSARRSISMEYLNRSVEGPAMVAKPHGARIAAGPRDTTSRMAGPVLDRRRGWPPSSTGIPVRMRLPLIAPAEPTPEQRRLCGSTREGFSGNLSDAAPHPGGKGAWA
jgi:hypothetical protein